MTSLKSILFPDYRPDKAVKFPAIKSGQSKRTTYDYTGLTTSQAAGQLQTVKIEGRTMEFSPANPKTDNGRKSASITPADAEQIITRKLDPDKAKFLKPVWSAGHEIATGTKVAHKQLRHAGSGSRGYGKDTVKKYWAAFNAAYEQCASSPPSHKGAFSRSEGKLG